MLQYVMQFSFLIVRLPLFQERIFLCQLLVHLRQILVLLPEGEMLSSNFETIQLDKLLYAQDYQLGGNESSTPDYQLVCKQYHGTSSIPATNR